MIYALLVLLIGLSISGVAAFYSIVGLTTIFSGSVVAVAIMGSVLEVGKLITASWLYRNWKSVGFLMKGYLTIAVLVLMFITSMGIFGYLSKAHIEQTGVSGGSALQVELIENKIKREQKQIDDATQVIEQLDKAVQILMDYDRVRGPTGAIATRQNQKEERAELNKIINEANENIAELQEKKIVLEREQIELEVEVGPIKYIAELVYGEEKAKGMLDEAVRAVILILILVFDPLAVLLLIAANISLEQVAKKKELALKSEQEQHPATKNVDQAWLDEAESRLRSYRGPSEDSLKEMPELTDEQLKSMKRLHEELPQHKPQIVIHDGIYDELDDIAKEEQTKPSWTEKVVAKQHDRTDIANALEKAYDEAKKSANIPFNLDGRDGEALKRILLANLTKKKEH